MSDEIWKEKVKLLGWPEEGTRTMDLASLYHLFKARLLDELIEVADKRGNDEISIFFQKAAERALIDGN